MKIPLAKTIKIRENRIRSTGNDDITLLRYNVIINMETEEIIWILKPIHLFHSITH